MKLKIFDVVELLNGSTGIIIENKNFYEVRVIEEGISEIIKIDEKDIKRVLFSK